LRLGCARTRWGRFQHSPRPPSWIFGGSGRSGEEEGWRKGEKYRSEREGWNVKGKTRKGKLEKKGRWDKGGEMVEKKGDRPHSHF